MQQLEECIPRQTLKEYLAGWIDVSNLETIEEHIAHCPVCEETIAELEGEPDTLAEAIQAAAELPVDEAVSLGSALIKAGRLMHSNDESGLRNGPEPLNWRAKIGPYVLLRPLGHGGMGSVFLAKHQQLGKLVAIKLLPMRTHSMEHFEARFQREIRAAGGLDHPSIVSATDAGQEQGIHFLVMEYVDGLDLSKLARLVGRLDVADACELVRQVALGLSQAHAAGIVHRDIKPSNLMLNQRGQVKILDFGLARLGPWSEHTTELTTVGQLMGTLDYMAPEQAEKAEAVDNRADLYSLGATLFRLLCGRAPLADSTDQSPLTKLRLLATRDAPGLHTLRPDAPGELAQLVQEMLARNPLDRPASAAHIANRLEPLCRGHQLQETLSRASIISEKEKHPEPGDPLFLHNLSIQLATTERADNKSTSSQIELEHSPKNHSDAMESSAVTHQSSLVRTSTVPTRWRWSNWVLGTVIGAVLTTGAYSGIILWLNSQEGWLHIESDARVTVELVDEGNATKEWKLQPGPNSTRLYAGHYRIELDKGSDGIQLDKDQLQVFKGGVVLAKIFKTQSGDASGVEAVSGAKPANSSNTPTTIPPASTALLIPGDSLRMQSRADPTFLNHVFIVQADHQVRLPGGQNVSVKGLTLTMLEEQLNELYKKFVTAPAIDLFRNDHSVRIELPASTAVLAPGDALWLRSNSDSTLQHHFQVQADLTVKLPIVGTLAVQGLTVESLREKLETLFQAALTEPAIDLFYDVEWMRSNVLLATKTTKDGNNLKGDVGSPTGDDAPLFKGRTLSEWMRVIPLEKDPEGIAQALAAISSATTDQTRPQIAAFLKQELPKLDWYDAKLQRQAFERLRSADHSHYFEYLREQLQATTDQNWKARILSESLPQNASFEDMQPLHPWLQDNILNQPGPYLETIANFYLRRSMIRYTNDGELSEESWMRPLIDCDHLSDLFWFKPTVENQAQQTFRAPERYWTEVVRQAIGTFGDSGADQKRLVYAAIALLNCPTEIKPRLIDVHAAQLGELWQMRAKQMAKDELFRRSKVDFPGSDRWQSYFSLNVLNVPSARQIQGVSPSFADGASLSWVLAKAISSYGQTPEPLFDVLIEPSARVLTAKFDKSDPWKVKIEYATSPRFASLHIPGNTLQLQYWPGYSKQDFQREKSDLDLLVELGQLIDRSDGSPKLSSLAEKLVQAYKRSWTRRYFSQEDADGDEQLSYDQFTKLPAEISGINLNWQPATIDADQDQLISLNEYVAFRDSKLSVTNPGGRNTGVAGDAPTEADLVWSKTLVEKYDKDKDGRLSKEEQSHMLVKPPKGADINNDGFLDDIEYAKSRSK